MAEVIRRSLLLMVLLVVALALALGLPGRRGLGLDTGMNGGDAQREGRLRPHRPGVGTCNYPSMWLPGGSSCVRPISKGRSQGSPAAISGKAPELCPPGRERGRTRRATTDTLEKPEPNTTNDADWRT